MPTIPTATTEPEVLYPEFSVQVCSGEHAITEETAKQILGWAVESEGDKFGTDYNFVDRNGCKVRCVNNLSNRPIYATTIATLQQEHLRSRWKFNGEPVIVGRLGSVLNGQHCLISLVFACQEYRKDPEMWQEFRDVEPTMEKVVEFGISEDDVTVNTLDTAKPRSLTDAIFRSEFFSHMKVKERREAARATDYAVKTLWKRTGAVMDAFAPRRTHSESLDFIARHPRVLECVSKVLESSTNERPLAQYLSLGCFAGILYLMGCSGSSRPAYLLGGRREESLHWGNWDRANELIDGLADELPTILPLRKAVADAIYVRNSTDVREAVLAKAWLQFVTGDLKAPGLKLQWDEIQGLDGPVKVLGECPLFGGIDIGDPRTADEDEVLEPQEPTPPATPPRPEKKKGIKIRG